MRRQISISQALQGLHLPTTPHMLRKPQPLLALRRWAEAKERRAFWVTAAAAGGCWRVGSGQLELQAKRQRY